MVEERKRRGKNGGGDASRTSEQDRREAEGRGERGPVRGPGANRADGASAKPEETSARPRRRRLTAKRKFEIFLECSAPGAPIGEILRREGLYRTDLTRIRQQVEEAAVERLKQGPGRKKKVIPPEEVDRLAKELAEKEKALAEITVEYLALKKGQSRASKGRSGTSV